MICIYPPTFQNEHYTTNPYFFWIHDHSTTADLAPKFSQEVAPKNTTFLLIHDYITTADLTQKRNKINQRFAPEATRLHDHIT